MPALAGGESDAAPTTARQHAELRPMCDADIDAILVIEADSFAAPWPRSAFEMALVAPELLCLVAHADGVAGYLIACPDRQHTLIANVAVALHHRRLGLGRRLMETALRWAQDRGADSCRLDVRMSNTAAQHLYEGLGFHRAGVRRGYYPNPREDALTMVWVPGA